MQCVLNCVLDKELNKLQVQYELSARAERTNICVKLISALARPSDIYGEATKLNGTNKCGLRIATGI
jgi:hypothetical protein